MRALLFAFTLCTVAGAVGAAEKFSSSNVDVRTVIGFKASEAAVQKVLPSGWEVASPTSGPLKGFNVSINLIESITAQDAEGKSVPVFRGAVLAVPAKKAGSQDTGVFVFTGLVGPESVPGAYGVYVPAKAAIERKVRSESAEKSDVEENWNFRSEDGSAIEVELRYERGALSRSKPEAKVYSAAKPDFFRIYKVEQTAEAVRSVPNNVDRVTHVSVKANGPQLSSLFDGSEQLIGVISIPWYSRQVFLPGS